MGKKMGRPRIPVVTPDLGGLAEKLPPKPIDMREVFYWMDLGGTQEEIAGNFHISADTLSRRLKEIYGMTFAELKEKICGGAKLRLRRNQYRMAEANASMAIWLGKQWLGQKEPEREDKFDPTALAAMTRMFAAARETFEMPKEPVPDSGAGSK